MTAPRQEPRSLFATPTNARALELVAAAASSLSSRPAQACGWDDDMYLAEEKTLPCLVPALYGTHVALALPRCAIALLRAQHAVHRRFGADLV